MLVRNLSRRSVLNGGQALLLLCLAAQAAQAQVAEAIAGPQRSLAVLIGGFDSDPSPEQLDGTAPRGRGNSGLFQLRNDLVRDRCCDAEYFNWNGTRAGQIRQHEPPPSLTAITQFIRDEFRQRGQCKIVIVGNSWGGHTAWEVCGQLAEEPVIPIDMLIFLDPSSAGRSRTAKPANLPDNVQRAVNYHTRNLFVWQRWPDEQRLINVDLGDPSTGFLAADRAYDGTFDWRAHVQAEWDDRIHGDILQRIRETLVPAP